MNQVRIITELEKEKKKMQDDVQKLKDAKVKGMTCHCWCCYYFFLVIRILLIFFYYIDTDEIPGFLLSLKSHIFTARIFLSFTWCRHGY